MSIKRFSIPYLHRRYVLCIALSLVTMLFSYCTTHLDNDFKGFVDKVEKENETYDETDWDRIEIKFNELLVKSEKLDTKLTEEQKTIINQQIGRYQALKLKHEAAYMFNEIEDAVDQIEGFVNEIAGDTNNYE